MLLVLVTLACGVTIPTPAPVQPGVETIVAATFQALTVAPPVEAPAATPPMNVENTPAGQNAVPTQAGATVSANSVSFVIPVGVGVGANVESIPEVTEQTGAPWEVSPAYSKFTLQGYPLQGKFFEPYILVYPAQEFEAANPSAADSLQSLRAILASPSAPLTLGAMPHIPTFNAGALFASNMQVIFFKNGSGVRFLTEYGQYYATANNHELFYNFQGLTSDGKYYIIAILPVNASFLAADDKPDAVVPPDGVLLPANGPDENYYSTVVQKLNAALPDAFTPSITALDALIQSMNITP